MAQAMCTSFKKELFSGVHNFNASGGHAFKVALFTGLVTLNDTTTAYSSSNEVASAGYTAGGYPLTNANPSSSGTTAMVSFASNPVWTGLTCSTTQALIYNVTAGGNAVAVLDFGGVQTMAAGGFTITFPPVTPTTALLRLV